MESRADSAVSDLSRLLKSTTTLNVQLSDAGPHRQAPADLIVRWLASRVAVGVSTTDVSAHVAALAERRRGGNSLVDAARRADVPIVLARSSRVLALFPFVSFDLGDISVSVDVLNAADELGLGKSVSGEVAEIFVLGGQRDMLASNLRQLLGELVRDLPVEVAFGGASAFTARFAHGLTRKQSGFEVGRRPEDFLWPLMFTRSLPNPLLIREAGLSVAEEYEGGYLIQTWPSLSNGVHEVYRKAAHQLGLGCLWDLRIPRVKPN